MVTLPDRLTLLLVLAAGLVVYGLAFRMSWLGMMGGMGL